MCANNHCSRMGKLWTRSYLLTLCGQCGWCAALSGACILKVLHGAWWIIVYELCLLVAMTWIFYSNTVAVYRLVMLTFLAISIPLLTLQIDFVLYLTLRTQYAKMAYSVGYILIIVVQYLWVLMIGSDTSCYLGQLCSYSPTIKTDSEKKDPSTQHHHPSTHSMGTSAPTSSMTLVSPSRQPAPGPTPSLSSPFYAFCVPESMDTLTSPENGPIKKGDSVHLLLPHSS
ncbi:hypothetical protein BDF14DRAFT_1774346 [Spinellus fusiger]|nr:hypothetical protein BDF14DRAFT_1774346 [Spinellus fusiger]